MKDASDFRIFLDLGVFQTFDSDLIGEIDSFPVYLTGFFFSKFLQLFEVFSVFFATSEFFAEFPTEFLTKFQFPLKSSASVFGRYSRLVSRAMISVKILELKGSFNTWKYPNRNSLLDAAVFAKFDT